MFWVLVFALLCIVSGFIASFSFFAGRIESLKDKEGLINSFSFPIGIISIVYGVIKLIRPDYYYPTLSIVAGDDPATQLNMVMGELSRFSMPPIILGDLLPAIALIIVGIIIAPKLLDYVNISDEKRASLKETLSKMGVIAGIAAIVLGFLHLFFYSSVLF